MARFTSTEASLYNGMSEQSAELRLPSQATDVENAKLTVAKGIERRPPFELSHEYPNNLYSTDSLVHPITYDKDTAYLMVIGGDDSTSDDVAYGVDVIGDPNVHPLVIPAGPASYLYTPNANGDFIPIEALQMTTILDTTFVCNKNVEPLMATTTASTLEHFGYIWVSNGVQEVDRSVTVGPVTHTHVKIPDNDSKLIIDYFETEINAQADFSAVRISDSILKVVPDVDAEFTLTATDSYSDTTMEITKTWGTKFESLVPTATNGERVVIIPESNTDAKYYLQYNEDTGVWSEVTAPGKSFSFASETMPHRFIRKLDDGAGTITGTPFFPYFELEEIEWAPRVSGGGADPEVLPSFIGNKISDTFFFKNRLGFISGESVILSAVDDLFNFWPRTVQEVLDDDPIDITVSSTRNIELSHAATFPDSLILIGDREQFSLSSGSKAFTAENVTLDPTTSYSASEIVPPVTTGSTMYFIAPQSAHASVREYAVQPDTLVTDAADVTAHVPTLLPNTIKQIIAEPNLEYLFLVDTEEYSSEEGNLIHIYKYYWQGNEKIQSSWQKWRVWCNPIGGMVHNGSLWMLSQEVVDTTHRVVLTRTNLSDEPIPEFDSEGKPYKLPRPNVDRELPVEVIGDITDDGCMLTIQVTQEVYEYFEIADVSVVMVDRISGLVYRYISRYTGGGNFYIVIEKPVCPTNLGELECYVLGSYTIGGCQPFPYVAPTIANTPNLNGTDQSFDAGDSLVYGHFDFFVTARFKRDLTVVSTEDIMSNQDSSTADIWRLRVQDDNRVDLLIADNGYIIEDVAESSVVITPDVWYTVVAGINTTLNEVYVTVNNETLKTAPLTMTFNNSGFKTLVGAVNDSTGGFWDGSIAFAGVGRGLPSASEIAELNKTQALCYNDLSSGLKSKFSDNGAFWELANWIGHTSQELVDQTGNGVTLTNVNSVPFTGTGLSVECGGFLGFPANTANLNGVDQYFDAGDPIELRFGGTSSISMEAWVYVDSAGNGTFRNIIRKDFGYYFRIDDDNRMFCRMFSSADLKSSNIFPTDTWSHVVVTYDGSNIRYYLNGSIDTTTPSTGNMPTVSEITAVGARSDGLELFNGGISKPKVFNRPLNNGEVTTLYNSGIPQCFENIDTSITDDCVYAPRLCNYNGNNGQELIDQSSSGITTTNINSTPFTGTGLTIEC